MLFVIIFLAFATANEDPGQPCNIYTNCASCVINNSSCSWCAESLTCMVSTDSSKCSCTGTCKNCFRQSLTLCPANYGVCGNHHNPATCVEDPACGWNVELETCVEGDSNGACWSSSNSRCTGTSSSAFYWQFGSTAIVPGNHGDCTQYSHCKACTGDPACGWNAYLGLCTPGDSYGACWSSDNSKCSGTASAQRYWQYGSNAVCPARNSECSQYTNCQECVTDAACGWNVYSGICATGDANGACSSSNNAQCSGTASKSSYWQYGTTAVCSKNSMGCYQYSSCDTCTSDPACGWNVYSWACYAGDSSGACSSSQNSACSGTASRPFYWQYSTTAICPRNGDTCSQYTNCMSCVGDSACGWNVYLQACTPGDQSGACYSSENSLCSGTCTSTYYWQFGAGAICPSNNSPCSQHVSCSSCTADKACGWNSESSKCTEGDQSGVCSKSNGPSSMSNWHYGSC